MNILIKFLSFIGLTLLSTQIIALPIDWSGGFTADTTLIKSYRRTVLEGTVPANSGSQEIEVAQGDSKNASFQTYIFKLSPTIIINDAATLKGEITTNYGRTEKLGDSRSTSELAGTDNLLYAYNSISGQSLNFSKLYLEYYSDTASYKIGRQGFDWGLGAIYNSGKNSFDRHSFARDGIVAQFKIGNFNIFPFWSKISQGETLTKTSTVTEYGINALYRNHESEITFGISYNSKKGSSNSQLTSDANTDSDKSLGTTDIKITDFYFSKTWKDFSLSLEIPLISGDLGNVFNSSTKTKYKSRAIIFESLYEKSHKWSFGFNFGSIGGTTGSTEKFEALYLNPNYHIANLLFRYNLNAVSDNQQFILTLTLQMHNLLNLQRTIQATSGTQVIPLYGQKLIKWRKMVLLPLTMLRIKCLQLQANKKVTLVLSLMQILHTSGIKKFQ